MDLVHSDLSLRCLSRRERLALGAICLCVLVLLAALQHGRVFLGDEIGTLKYLNESPGYILTHFAHMLSMNYFILVEKGVAWLCGAADWRLTLLPMAAAVAIIPLTASLALKFTGSTRTALIAASLAAFNPYLIDWGPAIRAYSLLVALSLLAINEFFHWYRRRDWWSGVRCAAVVLLLLLAHLNGVYTVAFLVLLLAAETIFAGWSERTKVSLGIQNSLDSVGWRGDNSRRSLLATPARYREDQRGVGNRYPANEHGIYSASL